MSSPVSSDEAPFVFGAYASHQSEVPGGDAVEAEAVDVSLSADSNPDLGVALSQLPNFSRRRH
ncbi:MAG TPA: hypothetical protein VEQ66_12740 [Propionibacteriaceae bacterium]|nr:hypothetical protein [Propionibacteriaceae bacterium]